LKQESAQLEYLESDQAMRFKPPFALWFLLMDSTLTAFDSYFAIVDLSR